MVLKREICIPGYEISPVFNLFEEGSPPASMLECLTSKDLELNASNKNAVFKLRFMDQSKQDVILELWDRLQPRHRSALDVKNKVKEDMHRRLRS